MGLIKDIIKDSFKTRYVNCKLSRSDYYKLVVICEAINDRVDADYEVTPEMIGTLVLQKWIDQSFEESTNKLLKQIVPEAPKLSKQQIRR